MDGDGSNQLDVSRNPWPDDFPAWSPDGQLIAYVAYLDGADPLVLGDGNAEIYVVARRRLREPTGQSAPGMGWRPVMVARRFADRVHPAHRPGERARDEARRDRRSQARGRGRNGERLLLDVAAVDGPPPTDTGPATSSRYPNNAAWSGCAGSPPTSEGGTSGPGGFVDGTSSIGAG